MHYVNRDAVKRHERKMKPVVQRAYRNRRGPWPPRGKDERIKMRNRLLLLGGRLLTETAGVVLITCPLCRVKIIRADLLRWQAECPACMVVWEIDRLVMDLWAARAEEGRRS